MSGPHDDLDALVQSAKRHPPIASDASVRDGWTRLRGSLGAVVVVPQIDVPPGLVESVVAGKAALGATAGAVGWGWMGKAIASAIVAVTVGGVGVVASGVGRPAASSVSQNAAAPTTPGAVPQGAVAPDAAPAELVTPAELPAMATPVAAVSVPSTVSREAAQPVAMPATKRRAEPRPSGAEVESPIIAAALKALSAGDAAGALAEIAKHRRQYPRGAMREDREALSVAALCKAGRAADAARARTKFLEEWPSSPHAIRVRATCSSG